jgi:hypothetical protein
LVPTKGPSVKAIINAELGEQLSLAVPPNATKVAYEVAPKGVIPQLTVIANGAVTKGTSVSLTVTVKPQVAVLPLASVTLKTFVVTPTGNAEPLVRPAVCIVIGPEQLSAAVGAVYVATALQSPASFTLLTFAGQVIVGNWVSLTVTVKPQVAVLPLASVTLKTFVVTPTGNAEPLVRPAVCIVV